MRPLRYSINITLDGCCDHRAVFADEELHRHAAEKLAQADALPLARPLSLATMTDENAPPELNPRHYAKQTGHNSLDAGAAPSFRDDAVRPFHERDKDRWIAEFCAPLGEIGVSHSAGSGARATSKNLNLTGHNFLHCFLERGPANRNHSLCQRQAHQRDRLP